MKSLLTNSILVLFARLIVGSVFLFASADKLADTVGFASAIHNYKILPPTIELLVATILPWLELLCGLALILGLCIRGSSALASLMLVVFSALVVSALARGLDISCGCFTLDPGSNKVGGMKIAQNVTLFAVSLFVYLSQTNRFTLEAHLLSASNPP